MLLIKLYYLRFLLIMILAILTITDCSQKIVNNSSGIVHSYGSLRVEGNRIVGENNEAVVLKGMSLFWSQWMGEYYNSECIKWLSEDWKCSVVRAAMGVGKDGYLKNPEEEYKKIRTAIETCIDQGIYVIADWHDHHAERHMNEAITFFKKLATEYGDKSNLIYEIFNEPMKVSLKNVS